MRTALLTILNALRIENAAQNVVANAGQILHAAAADQNHRVLLQIVAFTWDVAHSFRTRGQTNLSNLTQSRVRLLWVVV